MSRGVAKRVIVADPPDPALFERTIFILKDDPFLKKGVGPEEVIREAGEIADEYIREQLQRRKRRELPWVWALGGAGAMAMVATALWLLAG